MKRKNNKREIKYAILLDAVRYARKMRWTQRKVNGRRGLYVLLFFVSAFLAKSTNNDFELGQSALAKTAKATRGGICGAIQLLCEDGILQQTTPGRFQGGSSARYRLLLSEIS